MFPLQQKIIPYEDEQYELFIDQRMIKGKVDQIAKQINQFYEKLLQDNPEEDVVGLCILKGGVFFFTDIVKKLRFFVRPEFLFQWDINQNPQNLNKFKKKNINEKHVFVVMNFANDIEKISLLQQILAKFGAKSVNFVAFVTQPPEQLKIACKWIGFECPISSRMIGYGFDRDEYFRPLNQIYKKV